MAALAPGVMGHFINSPALETMASVTSLTVLDTVFFSNPKIFKGMGIKTQIMLNILQIKNPKFFAQPRTIVPDKQKNTIAHNDSDKEFNIN